MRGQELENAIIDANYIKAIQIAFELRRPRKLFELFGEIYRFLNFNLLPAPPFHFPISIWYSFFDLSLLLEVRLILCRKRDAEVRIGKALHALGKEELRLLLEYIRDWNSKPKFCHVAQFVLFQVFHSLPPTEIVEVSILCFQSLIT